ncbi:metallophosphoesterase, partial [Georgenia sp. 10Sc9-8]|nr:metallophosphoesterase [Georgenia halotolerans]
MNDSTARRFASTRRPAAVLGALSLGAVGLAVPAAADTDDSGDIGTQSVEEYVSVDVLAFNDFHGRLTQGGQSAGAAVLAGAADAVRAENEDTVLVSAGDNIGASTFVSMVQEDTPTIEALNAMDLFASAVGNHEFDRGADDLTGRVTDLADFPYLVANVDGDLPNIDEYAIYESPNGVSVGFIGVVTEDVPSLVTPAGIEGLEFTDMSAAANRVAAQLSDGDADNGEADVVVVLAHEGAGGTSVEDATGDSDYGDLVNNAENIDAIVSGHTHQLYNHEINGMQVTSGSQYGEHLTRLT